MRAALAFLTPLPVGAARPRPTTLAWFPVAGAVIGALVGAAWWAGAEAFPPLVAAGVAVVADLVLTGALHVDGLADSADGLLAHHDGPERRRAVMAAPDVGAFGVAAVAGALVLRWAAFSSLEPDVWLVVAVWAASRAAMALALGHVAYVGGGLGAAFTGGRSWVAWAGTGAALGLAAAAVGGPGVAAVGATLVAFAAVVVLGRRRLGGVTGDVLGAAGVTGETVGLVLATSSW